MTHDCAGLCILCFEGVECALLRTGEVLVDGSLFPCLALYHSPLSASLCVSLSLSLSLFCFSLVSRSMAFSYWSLCAVPIFTKQTLFGCKSLSVASLDMQRPSQAFVSQWWSKRLSLLLVVMWFHLNPILLQLRIILRLLRQCVRETFCCCE